MCPVHSLTYVSGCSIVIMARPAGFEPATLCLEGRSGKFSIDCKAVNVLFLSALAIRPNPLQRHTPHKVPTVFWC